MTVPSSPVARWGRIFAVASAGLAALLAQPCYAAHWQVIGPPSDGSVGLAYIDMQSIHRDGDYREAIFLTVYAHPITNAHGYQLDRIAQETAFDCQNHTFALISTVGFLEGRQTGRSSGRADEWKSTVREVPKDAFSQRTFDIICNAPLAPMPEPAPSDADAAATVNLPTVPRND